MADNAPEKEAQWPIDAILFADWPTMLRKNGTPAAFSSDFCSYYTYFYRQTSIILAYFRPDSLADLGPEYANWIERLQKDFRRVTRMRGAIMPNEESVLVLMGKTAMDKTSYNRILPGITTDKTLFPLATGDNSAD